MFCCHCGKEIPENAKFCGSCGAQVDQTPVWDTAVPPIAEETVEAPAVPAAEPAAQVYAAPVAAPAKPAKKKKKPLVVALCIIIPVLILGGLGAWFGITMWNNQKTYDEAQALLEEGKYEEAVELLEQISGYKDAEDVAEEWQTQLDAYNEAIDLLADRAFDEAEAAFGELEGFKDSDAYVQSIVPYEKAAYIFDCAAYGDTSALSLVLSPGAAYSDDYYQVALTLYNGAADIFGGLGDYQDAAARKNECYYQAGLLELEQENWSGVEAYIEKMDEYDAQALLDDYMDCCADIAFQEALQDALSERAALADTENTTHSELVEVEFIYLEEFNGMHFYDAALEELYKAYMEGLYTQYYTLSADGYTTDYAQWYTGTALRFEAVEALNERYGFLEDAPELKEIAVGVSQLYRAFAAIEEAINDQLVGVSAYYDEEAGLYYMPFENTTGYGFTLELYLEFYDGDTCILATDALTTEIPQDASGNIYLEFPAEDVQWDTWYISWDYYEISKDGNQI